MVAGGDEALYGTGVHEADEQLTLTADQRSRALYQEERTSGGSIAAVSVFFLLFLFSAVNRPFIHGACGTAMGTAWRWPS
jgi:hypothetical protein